MWASSDLLKIMMDSDPMPMAMLWPRRELMVIHVTQPTMEIHSLHALFRHFAGSMYAHDGCGA